MNKIPSTLISDAVESMSKSLQVSQTYVSDFKDMMAKSMSFTQQWENLVQASVKPLIDFSENIQKYHEREKEVLKKSGWYICPSLDEVPYELVLDAVNKYEEYPGGITTLMKKIYSKGDWSYLEEVVNGWQGHRFFNKQRMKIIRDALSAHKDELYTLTIPSLLPIIEGITSDYCKEKGIKVKESDSTIKAKKSIKELAGTDPYLSELVLFFIEEQLFINTKNLKNSKNRKYLNRHGILHGQYTDYADWDRSLRCFLFIDVLTLF